MNFYNLNLDTVNNILVNENLNVSTGEIKQGNKDLLVRAVGKFKSLEDIRSINIPVGKTGKLKLKEIAEVKDDFADPITISRSNQKDSVVIYIQKQTDANTVEVANVVRKQMKSIKENYNGINIFLGFDQSEFIQKSIDNVSQNALLGGLLAIVILFLFLRNFRSTIIIATAIPVSIIATFLLMYFADINLNIISLGGLALGVGMLVDNAIVVLENIYRYRAMGEGRIESAKEGSSEVGMAIVASTMTTVVVFMPVLFVEGLAARLFKDLAFTVAFSLLASLIVALTLIPMLSSKILKLSEKEFKRQQKDAKIIVIYKSLLKKALKHRWIVVLILFLSLLGSIILVPSLGFEFMPTEDDFNSLNQLKNLNIINLDGTKVPLRRIAEFELVDGPAEILRINQQRYGEITADLFNRDLGSVMNDIRAKLLDFKLPEGYEISYEGQFEDLNESFTALGYAFLLSIILIYMVMASQFESLIHPFIIMFAIPLAIIGVIFAMFLSSNVISVASLIGLITLAGVVVNNAIVMVDYINQLRSKGKEKNEAIINSGAIRFRPIMMTALTTILALLPITIGIGEGSELSKPIGMVIVSGLSFATFLTLFVIPIFYSLITDLKEIIILNF